MGNPAFKEQEQVESWEARLDRWLEPFLELLTRSPQRRWAPLYVRGLLGPGDRKSVMPMAERVAPDDFLQLHHFVSTSPWDPAPLEGLLAQKGNDLVGGTDAHLIIDDTAIVKKGEHSVGVAHQYCGQLGKNANCQALVSLTLARDEVPVPLALRLFLPESWTDDRDRCRKAGVPEGVSHRPKWQIALDELDRLRAAGVTFGDVLADAGYGACSAFRAGLSTRGLTWAVGIISTLRVFPRDVRLVTPRKNPAGGRRCSPRPSCKAITAKACITALGPKAFRTITWRTGTKGPLSADFAAVRVRVGDGPDSTKNKRTPGQEAWLVCERRVNGEVKYHLTNHTEHTSLDELAACIKARWSCEQAHQQLKEELGLDHYEGRSWNGLHHHALLTMMAFAFLQTLRCEEKKRPGNGAVAIPFTTQHPTRHSPRHDAHSALSQLRTLGAIASA
jgi:SRSO17 transposase